MGKGIVRRGSAGRTICLMRGGVMLLLCSLAPRAITAQTAPAIGAPHFTAEQVAGLNMLAEKWEQAQWRPMLAQCVRGEVTAMGTAVAVEVAKYGTFTLRSRLDSAKAANETTSRFAPLVARGRCKAKMTLLLTYFVRLDGVALDEQDELKAHGQVQRMLADWLPPRWAQVRAHMAVSGPDAFVRAGPWALSPALTRQLTQPKATDSELQQALAEAGGKMAVDYLTLNPWSTAYNQGVSTFFGGEGAFFDVAVMDRATLEQKVGTQMPLVTRLLKAMFCQLAPKPLPQGADTPGFTLYDICPTPP